MTGLPLWAKTCQLPLNTFHFGKSTAILPAAHLAEFETKPRNTKSTNEL
jgi:hypothetical protein